MQESASSLKHRHTEKEKHCYCIISSLKNPFPIDIVYKIRKYPQEEINSQEDETQGDKSNTKEISYAEDSTKDDSPSHQ
jgi:hypothetical protein